jgi:hypothetical protein
MSALTRCAFAWSPRALPVTILATTLFGVAAHFIAGQPADERQA